MSEMVTGSIVFVVIFILVICGLAAILHMLPKKPSRLERIEKKLDIIEKTLLNMKYR
jgi:hypothetical protein